MHMAVVICFLVGHPILIELRRHFRRGQIQMTMENMQIGLLPVQVGSAQEFGDVGVRSPSLLLFHQLVV